MGSLRPPNTLLRQKNVLQPASGFSRRQCNLSVKVTETQQGQKDVVTLQPLPRVLDGRRKGAEAQPHAAVLKLVVHKQLPDAQLL